MKLRPLLIRADATAEIGTGHVMRCLALAQAWQDTGASAAFLCARLPEALEPRLKAEALELRRLDLEPGSKEDAFATASIALETGAGWVVTDGYEFGAEYQKALKDSGLRVLFIDDYGHADSYCADLVLNQNIYAEEAIYARREPTTQLLLGPRYALLRREFLRWRDWERTTPDVARKVLVTMGGSDPANVTGRVLSALSTLRVEGLEVEVVVGAANPNMSALQDLVSRFPVPVRLETGVTDMPELMAWADLAVSAAGSTSWELLFMGLPALVVPLADNQEPVARALVAQRAVMSFPRSGLDPLGPAAEKLCRDPARRGVMSSRGKGLVDGRGANRILTCMKDSVISLRPATAEDCERVWHWANDAQTRANSFEADPIPWEKHKVWFQRKLGDECSRLFIALDGDGDPIGQVRFEMAGEAAVISVSVDPARRGKGLGPGIIKTGAVAVLAEGRVKIIHAYIKPGNDASVCAFRKAGFTASEDASIKGLRALHFTIVEM